MGGRPPEDEDDPDTQALLDDEMSDGGILAMLRSRDHSETQTRAPVDEPSRLPPRSSSQLPPTGPLKPQRVGASRPSHAAALEAASHVSGAGDAEPDWFVVQSSLAGLMVSAAMGALVLVVYFLLW